MTTGWRTPFIDAVLCVVLVLLVLVHPPKKDSDSKPPGSVIVEASWPANYDCDIDTWLRAPGDRPVGYSNKAGTVANLLRDDLGTYQDESGINMETVYGRWLAEGEWIVNLHLYAQKSCPLPIPVYVRIYMRRGYQIEIWRGTVNMKAQGEEITVARFTMKDGKASNVHDLPIKLRSGG